MAKKTNKYELMVILDANLGTTANKKKIDKLKKQLISLGAEIFHEEIWGEKPLAYRMKSKLGGFRENGYYALINFNSAPTVIREIETTINIDNEIIRHLFIKLPENFEPGKMTSLPDESEEKQ